ncbi:MAG: RNA 2',3'-cyclic phosphodiesterase [Candidatus Omnitrophica bacterium]|nr:RNA 2',3'-cyclic phosphodiesterase [Candidatus Omnitrophota bacterium]
MAHQTVRSFLAIELSERLKNEVQSFLESVGSSLQGFRLIPPQNWHLTLHFLGPIDTDEMEHLSARLAKALPGIKPFSISLGGFGAFPNQQSPRILWVGVRNDLKNLLELKQKLDGVLQAAHFQIEKKPFHPHITVARLKLRHSHSALKLETEFQGKARDEIKQITLFKSQTLPEGAIYTPFQIFRF